MIYDYHLWFRGHVVAYMVKALCYKPEGRRFETQWGWMNFSIYLILLAALGPGVHSASNRNESLFLRLPQPEGPGACIYFPQEQDSLIIPPGTGGCEDVKLDVRCHTTNKQTKQSPWSESASELYRPSDRRLSAKRLPTCADRGCHVVSVTDPYGRTLGFLDRSCYFSIK
jgi:hypothetical protein